MSQKIAVKKQKREPLIKENIERRGGGSFVRRGFFEDQSSRLLGLVFCLMFDCVGFSLKIGSVSDDDERRGKSKDHLEGVP